VRLPDPAFWRGRRVLVTGHTGFKGPWLCAVLRRLGAHVSAIALAPASTPNLWEDSGLAAEVDARTVDLRDRAACAAAVAAAAPEIVLHLAAQSLVRRGYREPVETYATNVMGTVHLLDAVRATPSITDVVVVTSDKVYADLPVAGGYTEDARLGGADPYAGSKACVELVVETFRQAYFGNGPRLSSARAGNVIGGGDFSADRLVPDFVRAIAAGETLVLRSPDATRPWQHALDPIAGYLLVAESAAADPAFVGAWNFGPSEQGVRVREVVAILARAWGREEAAAYRVEAAALHEAATLDVDAAKSRAQLGWAPRWTIAEALERTAVWYREYLAGNPARALVERDLDAYGIGR
jgi:CDP-glucose 4,6-dehydratase